MTRTGFLALAALAVAACSPAQQGKISPAPQGQIQILLQGVGGPPPPITNGSPFPVSGTVEVTGADGTTTVDVPNSAGGRTVQVPAGAYTVEVSEQGIADPFCSSAGPVQVGAGSTVTVTLTCNVP